MSSSHNAKKRKSTVLPRSTVDYLKNWMMSPDHIAHPYPTEKEKLEIMAATGIELKQLTNWFVNNRKRFWKPRVEARLQQQRQAQKVASMENPPQSIATRNSGFSTQQPIIAFNHRVTGMNSNPESRLHRFNEAISPPLHSFQIISNQQTFAPPYPSIDTEHSNSQVVSMGSVSYTSDSDNNSLSHSSTSDGDGEEQVIVTNVNFAHSPKAGRSPLRKRRVILESNMAHSTPSCNERDRNIVSPQNTSAQPNFPSKMKRDRSKSDLLCYTRESKNIVLRPRSLTFDNRMISDKVYSSKRRCIQDWQSACQNARHGYDASLPSLEEAASLFGYSGRFE